MNRDLINLFAIPWVSLLSWIFPNMVAPLLCSYLVTDCIRPITRDRDIQIIFHHVVTILFIIQNHFLKMGDSLNLFVILETSSYLLILGRVTGSRLLRQLSKIVWVLVRILWINWFHWKYYNYNFYIGLQIIKWLGYMWTLEIFKINLKPCHISCFAYNELIITQGDWVTSALCFIMIIPSYIHHQNYENKFWHNIDRNYVRFWILYCIWKFWDNCVIFRWHLVGVASVFPFITTREREWINLPRLLPHMAMHMIAGRGISLSLESKCLI